VTDRATASWLPSNFVREGFGVTRAQKSLEEFGPFSVIIAFVESFMLAAIRNALVALAALAVLSGCATLRLSGCARLAQCGVLAAYSCEGDLVCADADGRTISAETMIDPHSPCRICSSHARL
jgi:hypothetical protein